jgi:tripartite motif-containing protein 71
VVSPQPSPTPTPTPTPSPVDVIGDFTGAPGGLKEAVGLDVDPAGRFWVVEAGRDTIAIFDKDGTFVERWGESGTAPGMFTFHRSIGSPYGSLAFAKDGSFYVADAGNFRVQHFDKDRKLVKTWGGFGRGDGQFLDPISVAFDAKGDVYVADDSRDDVQVFTPDGAYLRTIGEHGTGPGQLSFLGEVLVDKDRVYVADFGNARIAVFATDGTFIENWTSDLFRTPQDLSLGPDGNLYVADNGSRNFVVLSPDGRVVTSWTPDSGGDAPAAVLALRDGRIIGSEFVRIRVYRLK